MEFFVKQSDLLRELQLAQGVVEKKSTIPVLSHIFLQALKFSLQLTSTDLELACRSSCPAKVRADGAVAVHARRLLEIVRSVGDSEIRFRLQENNWLQITCGRSSFKLADLEGDKFPAMPAVPACCATLPGKTLSGLIERTEFAAGNEANRFFSAQGRLLIARMMTGNFPNYESVLPREQKVVLELDADQVTAAVRRVSLLADEKSNAIHLALLQDRIEISSSGVNYGEATEVLDGQNDLEPIKIGFNYKFLLEFFEVVKKGEKVRMAFKDEMSAVDLVPVQEGFRYRYVVMPMRG
ncbi:MAG: DNA polymerase III subunit beta [Candidatus Acidiferrales bacterium]